MSLLKKLGLAVIAVGVVSLIIGVILLLTASMNVAVWVIIGSILVNALGLSMVTHKAR